MISLPRYPTSFVIALLVHAALLFGGGWIISKQAEFGMEMGPSNIEVDLVAAAPKIKQSVPTPATPEREPLPKAEPIITPPNPDDFKVPPRVEDKTPPPQIKDRQNTADENSKMLPQVKAKQFVSAIPAPQKQADGSSAKTGPDSTTLHSTGGAVVEEKPDFLKNPAPVYPENSRRLGHEGVTIIHVKIDSDGMPVSVTLKKSSGFHSLDEEALRAVNKSIFSPAKTGSFRRSSETDVTIRFSIKDKDS